jgi:hypothetical protein
MKGDNDNGNENDGNSSSHTIGLIVVYNSPLLK